MRISGAVVACLMVGCGSSGAREAPIAAERDAAEQPSREADAAPLVPASNLPEAGEPVLALHYSDPIDPGVERVRCLDIPGPTADTWVSGWRVTRSAVHHANLYARRAGTPYATPSACGIDPAVQRLFFDASQPELDFSLPPGTGMLMPAGSSLIVEVHELNNGSAPAAATVDIALRTESAPALAVNAIALVLPNIAVPAGATATISGSCPAPTDMDVVGLTSHSHAHDTRVAATLAGSEIYSSTTWAEPALMLSSMRVTKGAAAGWSCTIANDLPTAIHNCVSRDTCEMCELLGWAVMDQPWTCIR